MYDPPGVDRRQRVEHLAHQADRLADVLEAAATAQQLTSRPYLGIVLSVAIALAVTWLGLALAYFSIYPVGFYVTSLAFGTYVLVRLARR